MKYGLVKCCCDPITYEIVEQLKAIVKTNNLNKLFILLVDENCVLDQYHRFIIANYMICPYRKLRLIKDVKSIRDLDYKTFEINESSSKTALENNYQMFNFKTKRYLINNGLYGDILVKSMVNEKRYLHSLSVANICSEIAKSYNLDSHKAYIIGLYHDIAKGFNSKEIKQYIDVYSPYEKVFQEPVLHQFIGQHILSSEYKMSDKVALKAIRHHCLGDDNDTYSKIVYIADKCDPLRGYDCSEQYNLAKTDLDKAFALSKKIANEYIEKKKQ